MRADSNIKARVNNPSGVYNKAPNFTTISILAQPLLHFMVAIWVFSGSFVIIEPSPYELLFFALLPIAVIAQVGLHKNILPLFFLIMVFVPFALLAAFQVNLAGEQKAIFHNLITIYLLITAFFVANYVADAPYENMRNIMRAYLLSAIFAALLGTLAYLKLIPGEEVLTLYGRAKALFKDPNVFGPFLSLPAMFLLQKILLEKSSKIIWAGLLFTILFIGVFVSFSRAAWGTFLLSSLITFGLVFWYEADAQRKIRMLLIAIIGAFTGIITLAGLLVLPEVNDLFSQRFSVVQAYDGGDTGRFGRQGYAFELAIENPLGLGPNEFAEMRIGEAPHNTYVNVLHTYGWGGGVVIIVLMFLTLKHGFSTLNKHSPNRLLMIPLIASFISLVLEAAIIDVDHWRFFYFLIGLIWGVSVGYNKISPKQTTKHPVYL